MQRCFLLITGSIPFDCSQLLPNDPFLTYLRISTILLIEKVVQIIRKVSAERAETRQIAAITTKTAPKCAKWFLNAAYTT